MTDVAFPDGSVSSARSAVIQSVNVVHTERRRVRFVVRVECELSVFQARAVCESSVSRVQAEREPFVSQEQAGCVIQV